MSKKTMAIPSKGQFSVSKVKLANDGGLIVHYEVTEVVNEESYSNKFHVESAKDIHPDLKKLFSDLRPIIGRVFHLTSFQSLLATSGFKSTKAQNELGDAYTKTVLDKVEARGVSLSGHDDNVAVVITGSMTVGNGQKTAINTPRIKFNTETYGFEEELETIIEDIENEVYEFLFNGKKAQLELFGATGDPAIQEDEPDEHVLFSDADEHILFDGNDTNEDEDGLSDDEVFEALDAETADEDEDELLNAEDINDEE